MRATRAAALAALILILSFVALAPAIQAQACNSVGVSPPYFDIKDAQPGQSYVGKFSLQNPCPYGRDVDISMEGDVGVWTSTQPSSTFHLEPGGTRTVDATVQVPAGAGPGKHTGHLTFIGQAVQTGSGNQVATGYSVQLNVTVGGVAIVKLTWVGSRTPDVDTLTPPVGYATAENDGNVRATATMKATITARQQTAVLATGMGALGLNPGQRGEFKVNFTDPLPTGQYTMHFTSQDPAGYSAEAEFRVAPPGAPSGTLLALVHAPYGTAGEPLRIDARFRNDGNVTIRQAQLKAEVRDGDKLLAPLQNEPPLAVRPGETVNLTVYWTPPAKGTYTLVGHVVYDGYLTTENSSPLNVNAGAGSGGGSGGIPSWVWILVAAVVLSLLGGAWLLGRGRRRRKEPPRPKAPGDARTPQPWQTRK